MNLLDFVALDYKAPQYKFTQITHSNKYYEFSKTLDLLLQSNVPFEVRTTLHADLLSSDDINFILEDLRTKGYSNNYYIQEFLDTQNTLTNMKKPSKSFDKSLLRSTFPVIWR